MIKSNHSSINVHVWRSDMIKSNHSSTNVWRSDMIKSNHSSYLCMTVRHDQIKSFLYRCHVWRSDMIKSNHPLYHVPLGLKDPIEIPASDTSQLVIQLFNSSYPIVVLVLTTHIQCFSQSKNHNPWKPSLNCAQFYVTNIGRRGFKVATYRISS
jgi:hypothetical protein